MQENPGTAFSVGSKDARETSSKLQAHFVREKSPVSEQRNGGNYIRAPPISAVLAFRGIDSVVKLRLFLNEAVPHSLSVKTIPDFFHSARIGMEAQEIPKAGRKRHLEKPFEYLAHSKGGVYIVPMQQKKTADQVVFINARSRFIIDNAEEYPAKLSKYVFCLYGGPQATNIRVVKARFIFDQVDFQRSL